MTSSRPNEAVLEKLETELTLDLVHRLVGYADMKARRLPWYGLLVGTEQSLAEGHQPEDIVQMAITKTLRGTLEGPGKGRRVWDGKRDLFDHLTSAVDSELSNLGNGWVNQHFLRADSSATASGEGGETRLSERTPKSVENPEEVALSNEVEAQSDAFVCRLLTEIGDDDLLARVVEQILDGARRPAEIAAALGVPVDEVYKARKRLRRRVEEMMNSVASKGGHT